MDGRERIHDIERRFGRMSFGTPRPRNEQAVLATGWTDIDAALGGGLIRGALHEWFGLESDEATPDTKRPARRRGQAPRRSHEGAGGGHGVWTPPLLPVVHLVRRIMRGDSFTRYAVWIGRRCFPYGGALIGTDGDSGTPGLLERSFFVPADRATDRLWAVDLALRCSAIGVVVADGSGFDMPATRRIQLVARHAQTPALLVRPPWEVHELSAAQTRWLVRWEKGTKAPLTLRVKGRLRHEGTKGWNGSNILNPRWSVELLRCKGGQPECRPRLWALEWDRGQGALRLPAPLAGATGDAGVSTARRQFVQA